MKPRTKKIFYSLILTIYATVNLLSIFHFHPHHFSTGNYTLIKDSPENTLFDPYMDSNSSCQLQQFSQTNYLDNSFQDQTAIVHFKEVLFIDQSIDHPIAFEGWSTNLRAPPAIS